MLNMNWTLLTGIESLGGTDVHFLCCSRFGNSYKYAIFSGWFVGDHIGLEMGDDDVLAYWMDDANNGTGGYRVGGADRNDGDWIALYYISDLDIFNTVEKQK